MQTKRLPGYPGSYVRRTLPLTVIGFLFFVPGVYLLVEGTYTAVASTCIAGFLAIIFFMVIREYRMLLPRKRPCPDCGNTITRFDEGPGSEIHYDCKACGVRWETKLFVPDT